jgi:hypothetical protein
MAARRTLSLPLALVAAVALVVPVSADTGPATQDTQLVRVPFTLQGSDGRTYAGEAFVQVDLLGGPTQAGFFFSWRNLVSCDSGTPDPGDDFTGEELIDFTVDSITPSSLAVAANLSSASGTLTKSGHRIHTDACTGATIEDVVESHTFTFSLAATGPAKKTSTRERIDNGDGTITTTVVKEAHRPAAGSATLDVAGTMDAVSGADIAHIEVTQTTR